MCTRSQHVRSSDLVINVAVGEHGVEVMDTLLGVPVVVVLQPFFDCTHVHRVLYDLIVVLVEGKPTEKMTYG